MSDTLPDGRRVVLSGEPARYAAAPFDTAASSVACYARVATVLGVDASVPHASLSAQEMVDGFLAVGLADAAIDVAQSLEELGQVIENGDAVIALVDAGALWNWPAALSNDGANHAVLVVAAVRDARDQALIGALMEDPARPGEAIFVDDATLRHAWLEVGGRMVTV